MVSDRKTMSEEAKVETDSNPSERKGKAIEEEKQAQPD